MGRVTFDIPDELEIRLDAVATKLYGHKKGKKKKAVIAALSEMCDKAEKELQLKI